MSDSSYNIISKVQIPNGSTYEIKPSNNANINTEGVYFVTVTGTASALTGSINDLDSYYNGLKIIVYNNSGVSTNSECTLNINGLGAKSIKRYNTTNVGTIYNKTIALLCYIDGVFYHNNYYYTSNPDDYFSVMNIQTDNAYILKYALCAVTVHDKISSFTSNTTDSTIGKNLASINYRLGMPIFYRNDTKIASNTTTTSAYTLYENKRGIDIRYSMCAYNASRISSTGPTYFYMNVEVDTQNGTYCPALQATSISGTSDYIVCKNENINELIDDHTYIYLGVRSSSSNKYTVDFVQENPLYHYDANNGLIDYNLWQNNQTLEQFDYSLFEIQGQIEEISSDVTYINTLINNELNNVHIRDCSINAYTTLGPQSLCMLDTSGNLTGLVTTYTVNTGKTLSSDITDASIRFRLGSDIFMAGKSYEPGISVEDLSTLHIQGLFDVRYSSVNPNVGTSGGLDYGTTDKSMIFMPISIDFETKTFKLTLVNPTGSSGTTNRTNLLSINKLIAGFYYIFIGYRRRTSSVVSDTYIVDLVQHHPIYYYEPGFGLVPLELRVADMATDETLESTYEHRAMAPFKVPTKYDISTGSLCMISKDKELCTFSQSQTTFNLIPNTVKFDIDAVVYIYDGIDRPAGADANSGALLQATKDFSPLKLPNIENIPNARMIIGISSGKYNVYMPINLDESDGSFSLMTVQATNGTNTYTTNVVSDSESAYSIPTGFYKLVCTVGNTSLHAQMPLYNPVYYYNGTSFIPYNVWKNNQQDLSISDVSSLLQDVSSLLQDVSTHVSVVDASVDYIYDTSLSFLNMNTIKDSSIAVGEYPLNKDSLCMVATDGKLYPFVTKATTTNTTSSGSGSYNTIPNTIKFRIGTDVFIAGKTYSANALAVDVSSLYMSKEVDIRYSTRYITTNASGYAIDSSNSRNRVFLCINIDNEHGEFTISKTYISSGGWLLPIVAESQFTSLCAEKFYMFLGYASKCSDYKSVWISPKHPIYYYDGTNFIEYNAYMHDKHDQLLDDIGQHITALDASIDYLNTLANYGMYAPIAGQDIYASPEYPAIVCTDYDANYGTSGGTVRGRNLLYDFMQISSARHINLEWGYALLTHNVSAGDPVNPAYLHKKGTYLLHPNTTNTTKQGAYTAENSPSMYRYWDSSLYDFLWDNSDINYDTQYDTFANPDKEIDGPTIYGILYYNANFDNNTLNIPSMISGWSIPSLPYANFDRASSQYGMYISNNLITGLPFTFDASYGPIFYYLGKTNYDDTNGEPYSISLDFTNSTFQAYDHIGNQRSIPGYAYSAGNSILEGTSGGNSYPSLNLYTAHLDNDKVCTYDQDTSIFLVPVDLEGQWKVDVMMTVDATKETGIDCFLSVTDVDYTTATFNDYKIIACTTAVVPARAPLASPKAANIYMHAIFDCEIGLNPYNYVMLSVYPYSNSVTVRGIKTDVSTSLTSGGATSNATSLHMLRISPDVPDY